MKTVIKLFVVLLLTLITYNLSLITIFAASPPNPQPCKNPASTDLVNNYMLDASGKPPIVLQYQVSGNPEDPPITLPAKQFTFKVNFSQLQAIFGASNSNYLEGHTQSQEHQQEDIMSMGSQNFNEYFRGLQKTVPKVLLDEQKVGYVNFITGDGHTLPESANTYTDIDGQGNPKTIYDLVQEFGIPNPPESGGDQTGWNNVWGKYWAKIPTAWNQFYKAKITFHQVNGENDLDKIKSGADCPPAIPEYVNFVMPDFYRTTAIGDQMNRNLVPLAVQSYQQHHILNPTPTQAPGTTQNPLSDFFSYCWKLITSPASVAKDIKKTISLNLPNLLSLPNPLNPSAAFATNDSSVTICVKILNSSKNGQAPYCPLPIEEISRLAGKVSCSNINDNLKLEKDNPNVDCTFTFTSPAVVYKIDPKEGGALFPVCVKNEQNKNYDCKPKVYIIPNFQIPWLSAIWNNTLTSDKDRNIPYQDTSGRPGIYTLFTPKAISEKLFPLSTFEELNRKCTAGDTEACVRLDEIWQEIKDICNPQPGSALDPKDFTNDINCENSVIDSALPGSTNNQATNPKEQFVGATECSKYFISNNAFKNTALRESMGLSQNCDLTSSTGSGNSSNTPPENQPPNNNNCNSTYNLNNPLGNFGDPNCDFDTQKLRDQIMATDPANLSNWLAIALGESGFNPNAYNPHAVDAAGAWGLFQMGRGKNGELDHGDVNWTLQIFNALNYNKTISDSFCYWDIARQLGIAKNCV